MDRLCTHFAGNHAVSDYLYPVQAISQLATELVVLVDDCNFQSVDAKQPGLGGAVTFHVTVIIEMVAREIGEHGDIEMNAGNPVLFQGMR